ncbi:TPA: hypothetical protein ACH3X1_014706 [Trebouxia sp. C0004]
METSDAMAPHAIEHPRAKKLFKILGCQPVTRQVEDNAAVMGPQDVDSPVKVAETATLQAYPLPSGSQAVGSAEVDQAVCDKKSLCKCKPCTRPSQLNTVNRGSPSVAQVHSTAAAIPTSSQGSAVGKAQVTAMASIDHWTYSHSSRHR